MSKIALTPNASGTGTLTVAAPNTNSDYTLTLPAETGTVLTSGGAIDVNASAPADSVAIDSSGRVGIGTSSPVQKEHLDGGAGDTYLQFSNSTTGATSSDGARIGIASADNTLRIQNLESSNIRFDTAGTERMRIDSSGNLLVGTTSALTQAARFAVLGASLQAATNIQVGTDSYPAINFNNSSGVQQGYIVTNTSSVSYTSISDYRLKENVAPMTGALDKVAQLKPCTYTWKADGSAGQGFIAHELQAVVPDCVTGEKDAVDAEGNPVYQGVDTSFLVATLTAAIQELKAELDAAKERIAALEAGNVPT